jgi:HPt (histidine-containing phosphotransfer) domain-containing protein
MEQEFDTSVPRRIWGQFGPEPFAQLLAIFRADAHRMVESATTAVDRGDVEEAFRAAHSLKSNAAIMGASRLEAVCCQLEALAWSGSLVGAKALVAALAPCLASALERLAAVEASLTRDP